MFSWSIHTTADASKIALIIPLHYMLLLIAFPMLFALLIYSMKPKRLLRNVAIALCIALACGFLTYSTELTLDRTSETATLREFQFFHWTTHTYPLDQIERLYVSTGSTTSQVKIQFTDGSVRVIDFLDQNGGKDRVVHTMNQFLQNERVERP